VSVLGLPSFGPQACPANPLKNPPAFEVADGREFVDPLRTFWRDQRVIEGIDTHEGARLALDHGFDGLLVFQPISLPLHLRYA